MSKVVSAGHARKAGRAGTASVLITVAVLPFLLITSGCGGGGGTTASDSQRSVTLAVVWPPRPTEAVSRALPESANSLSIAVTDSVGFTDTRTLNRPLAGSGTNTVKASFFGLTAGTITIVGRAFSGTDGTGTLVSAVNTSVNVNPGNTESPTLNFPAVAFSGVTFNLGDTTILQGATLSLSAKGIDDNGLTIQTNPPGVWSSSNTTTATVSSSGQVTAAYPGKTVITFTDSVFNKSTSLTVTVRGGDSEVILQ